MSYSDDMLRKFLEGELDPHLAAELEQTMRVDRELERRVMELDTLAPVVQNAMQIMPGPELTERLKKSVLDGRAPTSWTAHLRKYAAILLVGAVAGGAVGTYVGLNVDDDWRGQVAQYQSLYIKDTVAFADFNDAVLAGQMAIASDRLKRTLDPAALDEIGELQLARTQILGIEDAPLAQIAYRDANGVPFALCITPAENGRAAEFQSEMLYDLATTAWQEGGFRYILVGGTDLAMTERHAAIARDRLSKS